MLNITSLKTLLTAILLLSALQSGSALANSGGKEANAGTPTAVLEPFTVNLSSFDRYLQINITLQVASVEAADKIKLYMPVVRHSMIMLLSGKESAQIQNSEGKHALIDEIKERLNGVLGLKEHDGVTDVFFVNFVIQ
ncbi:flagellar basal body-associated FliL family protein [Undibacterium oligocarboniphilum]|uniref:Flagellar protein FliL n=1 Tax=Undibacterium oligocarboniphilum TaxID=666702 RepID=A0A850QF27_9BURK|nr:flagellar basal body-associated FliL family protein [Undibacterium oligocarboniphilum]MBC3869539.1 flagellar basal body-associated FliL family protein [Undibacterium oligocarboniphilum]NVO77918.1 flagellar basal body-associated FliL family protein [Undibacterium oligocarboniphilum]